jgi:hypothetical protein
MDRSSQFACRLVCKRFCRLVRIFPIPQYWVHVAAALYIDHVDFMYPHYLNLMMWFVCCICENQVPLALWLQALSSKRNRRYIRHHTVHQSMHLLLLAVRHGMSRLDMLTLQLKPLCKVRLPLQMHALCMHVCEYGRLDVAGALIDQLAPLSENPSHMRNGSDIFRHFIDAAMFSGSVEALQWAADHFPDRQKLVDLCTGYLNRMSLGRNRGKNFEAVKTWYKAQCTAVMPL